MAPRSVSKTQRRWRTLDPKKALLIKQGLIGCCLAVLLGGLLTGIWHGTRLEAVTITEIAVFGGDTIDHEQVRQIAENVLQGSYFRLIPKKFTYLYPEQTIHEMVIDIDRLATVIVERQGRNRIIITVTEHIPTALWCEADGDNCLFLNSEGKAFAPAPNLSGGSLLRIYDTSSQPQVRKAVYEAERFSDLLTLVEALETDLGWSTGIIERELDDRITIQLTNGAKLFVRLEQPVNHTIHYLASLLRADGYEHLSEQPFGYIDLRFGNRLFVSQALSFEGASTTPMSVDTVADTALDLSQPTLISSDEIASGSNSIDTVSGGDVDVTQTNVVELQENE